MPRRLTLAPLVLLAALALTAAPALAAPPVVSETYAVGVSATAATLHAVLSPEGEPTTYRLEYLTEAEYEANGKSFSGSDKPVSVPQPEGNAGSGTSGASVSILVEDLAPATSYRYRAVATNALAPAGVDGPDRTFTTQATTAGSHLIDGRAWEMVSPPDKHGAALEAITLEGGLIQAAENGGAITYIANSPVTAGPEGNRGFAEQQLLASRGGSGWSTQAIATAHEGVSGLFAGLLSEYKVFSPGLSAGLVEPEGRTPLSPLMGSPLSSERTVYLREGDGGYTPLAYPGNVPEGTRFGDTEQGGRGGKLEAGTGVEFAGASPDLAHVVVSAPQSLVQGFQAGGLAALYEWGGGVLTPVSVLPGGASAAAEEGARLGFEDQLVRNAVSADGSRVFFEAARPEGHLYVRDVPRNESVQLDAPEAGAGGGEGEAVYQDASSSGDRAFFTDGSRLTTDATSTSESPELYMCEVGALAAGELDCSHHLKDLSVGFGGQAADVLGAVLGVSEDGSSVFFLANGVLSNGGVAVAGAVPGDCVLSGAESLASPERSCDLYMWRAGVVSLVAVLSNRDSPDWQASSNHSKLAEVASRVSGNGRWLAFMSRRPLTGFDNRDARSGEPDQEVFEFDAATGRLVCASCDPSGARPTGVLGPRANQPSLLADRAELWSEQWVAGSVPGWTATSLSNAYYQSRYLSDAGRLFFDSPVGLVPADANGRQDVYEYEPQGLGPEAARCGPSATGADQVFKPADAFESEEGVKGEEGAGCLGLISSGTSGEESVFIDAGGIGPGGQQGEDVFFLTAAKLSPSDTDTALDVYDAHVCSTASPCPSTAVSVPPACTNTDSCRAAPTPSPKSSAPPPPRPSKARAIRPRRRRPGRR